MKKILKILIIFTILLVLYPNYVIADTDIKLDCYDEVMVGNKLECKVNLLNSDQVIKGIQMNYNYDNVFSYIQTNPGSNWSAASINNEGFVVLNLDGINKNDDIVQIEFLVSNDAIVQKEYKFSLSNIYLSDGDKDISIANKSANVKVLSILDILESISIDNNSLFLKDGVTDYNYEVSSDVSTVNIKAVLKNEKYDYVKGYEPRKIQNLKTGDNPVEIKIKTGERELITFNINIKRLAANKEVNNNDVDNPDAGTFSIYIVIFVLLISVAMLIFSKQKVKKVD